MNEHTQIYKKYIWSQLDDHTKKYIKETQCNFKEVRFIWAIIKDGGYLI